MQYFCCCCCCCVVVFWPCQSEESIWFNIYLVAQPLSSTLSSPRAFSKANSSALSDDCINSTPGLWDRRRTQWNHPPTRASCNYTSACRTFCICRHDFFPPSSFHGNYIQAPDSSRKWIPRKGKRGDIAIVDNGRKNETLWRYYMYFLNTHLH